MTGKEKNRFDRLRVVLLLAVTAGLVLYGLGVRAEPLLLRFGMPAAYLVVSALLVYLNLLRFRRGLLALLGIAVALFIVEAVFAGMEIRAGYLGEQRSSADAGGPAVLRLHPDLVYWMQPNVEGTVSRRFGDVFAYKDVPFHTDQLGRRVCPALSDPAPQHALFFGGSFTFGQGITDDQTVPCIFQELSEGEYQAYNYGKNGYGAGQMYWLLQNDEFFEAAMQPEGIAVYNFIEDHIWRTVGELGKLTNESLPWMEFPLFKTDPATGELVSYRIADNKNVYASLQAVRTFRLLSPTGRYFFSRLHIPLASPDEAVRIMAEVVIQSQHAYLERFSGEFYVLLWPRVGLQPAEEAVFSALLEEGGVHVIKIPEVPAGITAQIHPQDAHPSPAEYRWVAENLYKRLNP